MQFSVAMDYTQRSKFIREKKVFNHGIVELPQMRFDLLENMGTARKRKGGIFNFKSSSDRPKQIIPGLALALGSV